MNAERLADRLARHRCAAVVASGPANVFYLTGYDGSGAAASVSAAAALWAPGAERPALVLPVGGAPAVVAGGIDRSCDVYLYGPANLAVPERRVLTADERRIATLALDERHDDLASALGAALARLGVTRGRAIVDQSRGPAVGDELARAASAIEALPGGEHLLRVVRMVKTPAEVERLRHAAAINELAIEAMLARVADLDDFGLAGLYEGVVRAHGGRVQHWIGAPGRHAGAYRRPAGLRAAGGDRWRFDVGIVVDGYCSDLGGTVQVAARPSAAERDVYAAITAGIERAVAGARAGVRASELYAEVVGAIHAAGLRDRPFPIVGHGIGVEQRDYPIVGPARKERSELLADVADPLLEAGMVVNFELPVNLLGQGGFQHEVTCLVGSRTGELMSPLRAYAVVGDRAAAR